jgi:hypothetical protein
MTRHQESKDMASLFADESTLAWMEEHLSELKQSVSGQRLLYSSLIIGSVLGLATHIGGYFLRFSAPGGFLGLLADLLYALGWSLWTGVVVTLFVQVIPEVKRRQIKQAIKTYEALRHEKGKGGGKH